MDKYNYTKCVPVYGMREGESSTDKGEDLIDLSSSYIQRSKHLFPRQGHRQPWKYYQNYFYDLLAFKYGSIQDGVMQFD